jgi:hypothetical protein
VPVSLVFERRYGRLGILHGVSTNLTAKSQPDV